MSTGKICQCPRMSAEKKSANVRGKSPRMSAEKSPRMSAEKVRECPRKKSATVRGKSPRMSANVHGKVQKCPRHSPRRKVGECPRMSAGKVRGNSPRTSARNSPRMSASDCPPRTFADRVHECPRKSANVRLGEIFPWTYADIRGHSQTYNIMFFVYLKKVHVCPRESACVRRILFQFCSRTFADFRGLSRTAKSPRESEG